MATTRIISMHINKGKTVAQCLTDRTDYAKNPEKTEDGSLVSSYECDPKTVDAEFLLSKREYRAITGRTQVNDVIAYQVRQSFKPGEVTPVEANQIGYELASRFLKDNHAFIVATHTDKAHIHNHIIWNSTTLDCTRKFRDFLGSGRAVAKLSDQICLEHRLSIIEHPRARGMSYNKWLGQKAKPSHRDGLRQLLDDSLEQKPDSFDALLTFINQAGWEVKQGKDISLRGPGQERYIRMKSLGPDYDESALHAVIAGQKTHLPQKKVIRPTGPQQVNLLVDIQAKLQNGKGAGYERWAKVFNLKQMAQSLNFLSEHGLLDYNDLLAKTDAATTRHSVISTQIKKTEKQLGEIAVLKTHILNYIKTRDTYTGYCSAGYSKKYLSEHEQDILLHKAAKKAFDELGVKKLPTIRSLQSKYAELLSEKKAAYTDYRKARDEMRELLTVKANVDRLLGEDDKSPLPKRER